MEERQLNDISVGLFRAGVVQGKGNKRENNNR